MRNVAVIMTKRNNPFFCLNFLVVLLLFFSLSVSAQSEKLSKQAEQAMNNGDFVSAESLWRDALSANPQNKNFRLGLSYALFKLRRLSESYNEAERVKQIEPENPRAWALMGAALLNAGNLNSARQILDFSLLINPNESLALAYSGLLDFYEGKTRLAIERLRRAIRFNPREPDFFFALGNVAARFQRYNEAADAFEHFLKIAFLNDDERRRKILGLVDFMRYLGTQKSLYNIDGKKETTLNCEIISNRPVINLRINNSPKIYRFVLDTGSGMTVVSDETAESLGIKPIAKGGMARALGGTGKYQIVYGFLSSMKMGDVRVSNVPVYIRKFYSSGEKVDGYLGLSAIEKFLVTIDYRDKLLTLARAQKRSKNFQAKTNSGYYESPQDNRKYIPLHFTTSGFLSGEVKIEGINIPLNFIIDTGAGISVVDEMLAQDYKLNKSKKSTLMRVFGAAGVTENVLAINLPQISFGDQVRENIQTVIMNLEIINENAGFDQAGILGGNFWQNSRLTFDFRNAVLVFEPIKVP